MALCCFVMCVSSCVLWCVLSREVDGGDVAGHGVVEEVAEQQH